MSGDSHEILDSTWRKWLDSWIDYLVELIEEAFHYIVELFEEGLLYITENLPEDSTPVQVMNHISYFFWYYQDYFSLEMDLVELFLEDFVSEELLHHVGDLKFCSKVVKCGMMFGVMVFYVTRPHPTASSHGHIFTFHHTQAVFVQGENNTVESYLFQAKKGKYKENIYKNVETIPEILFVRGQTHLTKFGANKALGSTVSGQDWISYRQFRNKSLYIASGLMHVGLSIEEVPVFFGILGKNSMEYLIAEFALLYLGMIVVAVHDHFGIPMLINMVRRTYIVGIVVLSKKKAEFIIRYAPKTLRLIVINFEPDIDMRKKAKSAGFKIFSLEYLEELGKSDQLKKPPRVIQNKDFALCFFTVSHGYKMRGVLLSHRNVLAAITGVSTHLQTYFFCVFDRYFAYVPRKHCYELIFQLATLITGGQVVFYGGNNAEILSDIKFCNPTVMIFIPRFLDRLYLSLQKSASRGTLRYFLYSFGIKSKTRYLERGTTPPSSIWDRILFHRIHRIFGGRIRLGIITGGPIHGKLVTLLRSVLNCVVVHSYGVTESCGVACMTVPGDNSHDHVGPPIPCVRIHIEETKFNSHNEPIPNASPPGEVWIKGRNVARQYVVIKGLINASQDDKTIRVTNDDGYHTTKDIGRLLGNGTLQLLGRADRMKRVSHAGWFDSERLEKHYRKHCNLVQDIYLHLEVHDHLVIAIVRPDLSVLSAELQQPIEDKNLDHSQLFKDTVHKALFTTALNTGLKAFERPDVVVLADENFPHLHGFLHEGKKDKDKIEEIYADRINEICIDYAD